MDSLEDRIHKAGWADRFNIAYDKFANSNKNRAAQQDFYDKLEEMGASPEEADEFVNMCMEG